MFSIFEDETMGNTSGTLTFIGYANASTAFAEGVMEIHIRGTLTRNGYGVNSIKITRHIGRSITFRIVLNWACNDVDTIARHLKTNLETEICDRGSSVISSISRSGCQTRVGGSANANTGQNNNSNNNANPNPNPNPDPKPKEKTLDEWLEENASTVAMGSLLLLVMLRR